jgi:hypothetical protein
MPSPASPHSPASPTSSARASTAPDLGAARPRARGAARPAKAWWALAVALAVLLPAAACGGSSSDSSDGSESGSDAAATASTTRPAADDDDHGDDDASGDEGDGGTGVILTSEDVCDTLDASLVGEATGLGIGSVEPDDGSTVACMYEYEGGSNITIAALTNEDLGGVATPEEAFDRAVQVNKLSTGADPDSIEVVEVDAGEEAVRMSAGVAELAIVRTSGHLFVVIAPAAGVAPAQVEALLVAIADVYD